MDCRGSIDGIVDDCLIVVRRLDFHRRVSFFRIDCRPWLHELAVLCVFFFVSRFIIRIVVGRGFTNSSGSLSVDLQNTFLKSCHAIESQADLSVAPAASLTQSELFHVSVLLSLLVFNGSNLLWSILDLRNALSCSLAS